jgi:tRNA nucleotidyltransferase (CCA-adding enzyme)
VIYYGGFEKLLMQASLWGERVVIDIERHWKDPLKALNTSKTISPLVIVDPIQPDRNAAAAVSLEKFHLFKESARAFLHEPSADFFKVKKLNISELKKKSKGHLLFLVEAVPVEGKDDVVGTKLLKCHELFQKRLLENDFKLLESGWQFSEKTIMFYIVKREVLSKNVFLHGPPVHDSVNCDAFRAKHKKVVERKGVLYAEEKRQFLTPHKLFKCLLKDEYVLEKVKRIRLL